MCVWQHISTLGKRVLDNPDMIPDPQAFSLAYDLTLNCFLLHFYKEL